MRNKIAELKEMVRDDRYRRAGYRKDSGDSNYGKRNHDANNNCAYKKK